MYFKKQLIFVAFMATAFLFILYKIYGNKKQAENSTLVKVEVIALKCLTSTKSGNSSAFKFIHNNKKFSQSISYSKCKKMYVNEKLNMYYSSKNEEFLLPEVVGIHNYKSVIYFFIGVLIFSLIPYKSFLN